jgi:hypothetical protein
MGVLYNIVKERLDGNDFDQTGTIFAKIKCINKNV